MRRFLSFSAAAAAIVFLVSCVSMMPPVSPRDAQAVLAKAEKYRTGGKSLGRSTEWRIPLQRGQWVASLIRSKRDANDVTLQIVKVSDVHGRTVTLETEQYSSRMGGKRTVIQHRIGNFPVSGKLFYSQGEGSSILQSLEVQSVKMLDEHGAVQEMPQFGVPAGRLGAELLKSHVAAGDVRADSCAKATDEIKATRCYLVPYSVNVLWISDRGTTYAHSEIPITGMIRSEGELSQTAVIGYGSSGAEILIR